MNDISKERLQRMALYAFSFAAIAIIEGALTAFQAKIGKTAADIITTVCTRFHLPNSTHPLIKKMLRLY